MKWGSSPLIRSTTPTPRSDLRRRQTFVSLSPRAIVSFHKSHVRKKFRRCASALIVATRQVLRWLPFDFDYDVAMPPQTHQFLVLGLEARVFEISTPVVTRRQQELVRAERRVYVTPTSKQRARHTRVAFCSRNTSNPQVQARIY